MKSRLSLVLFISLLSLSAANIAAQSNAAQTADDLRSRLLDIQTKEAELQDRARQLDEDLKPENIERSLAGVGSTKPEELREQRRRQLSIEREGIRNQLKILAASRERLEAGLQTAEARAYQQSAREPTTPATQMLSSQNSNPRWLIGMVAGVVIIMGAIFAVAVIRRRKSPLH